MARFSTSTSRSLREFRLLPGFTASDASLPKVSLETSLCRDRDGFLRLHSPIVGAAMGAVTGPDMAVALAQLGGIGVLPVSQGIEEQCAAAAEVKRFKAGFQRDLHTLSPDQGIAQVISIIAETGYTSFPVTDTGLFHGRLVGVLTDKDFDPRRDLECRVADRMRKDVQVGVGVEDLDRANQLMIEYGRGFLPIVSEEGTLQSVVFKKDRDKHLRHPDETVDEERRLRVAAAVSTHPEDRERVRALLDYGVDVLCLDASDGHTEFQGQMIASIRALSELPLIGGNVVTASGFEFLVAAGVDAVKVGMGIGSGCTTQEVRAAGRGQATALIEIAAARDRHADSTGVYVPLIADGGMATAADIAVALALGADTVMLGNLLARFTESPGQLRRDADGETWKEYWMEGSARAYNRRRYAQSRNDFFEEGIEGWVPHLGSVYDGLPRLITMLKSALATSGARDIKGLHQTAMMERLSEASLRDAAIHGMRPLESLSP